MQSDYALLLWEVTNGRKKMSAHPWWLMMLAPLIAIGSTMAADAVGVHPAAVAYQLPDQIKWNPPSAGGSQNAVMVGDPAKPGLYVVLNKWLKGNHFSRPHFHPNDRFITVVGGTRWMA